MDQANCFSFRHQYLVSVPPTLLAPNGTNGEEGLLPVTGWLCPALQSLAAQYLRLSLVSEIFFLCLLGAQAAPCCPFLRREAEAELSYRHRTPPLHPLLCLQLPWLASGI